ncbi:MAG: hypothetical protein IPJ40_23370 [Saprospirales bacterium]|nr:hypothetical protein [Saprospirales bacterium]
MGKDYFAYHFWVAPELQEALLALLTTLPFESFEEREDCLIAYLPVSTSTETLALEIEHLRGKIPFTFKAELMEDRNWNVLWESNSPRSRSVLLRDSGRVSPVVWRCGAV